MSVKDIFTSTLHLAECRALLASLPDNSIDSIVTDPPYELGFMGKGWDKRGIAYNVDMWRQALRVLKPGGYMLAFSSTRTYHRMTCAIEDAGFEIRDQIGWMYGSGFPKSKNIETDTGKKGTALKPAHEPICVARKARFIDALRMQAGNATGGVVLDHFMGSGSTGVGAVLEGFIFIGGDEEPLYFPISTKRVEEAHNEYHNSTQDMFEAA